MPRGTVSLPPKSREPAREAGLRKATSKARCRAEDRGATLKAEAFKGRVKSAGRMPALRTATARQDAGLKPGATKAETAERANVVGHLPKPPAGPSSDVFRALRGLSPRLDLPST